MCCSRAAGAACGCSGVPCVYRICELLFLELKAISAVTEGRRDILPEGDEDPLHGEVPAPIANALELGEFNLCFHRKNSQLFETATTRCQRLWETNPAILAIDTGEVDPGDEVDNRWLIRVRVSAVNFKAVDAVLMVTLRFKYRSARR